MSLPIIDLELGKSLAANREDLALEMLTMLKDSLKEDKPAIIAAYEKQDLDATQALVHRLHGAVSYCGVPELKEATKNLEVTLKEKNLDDLDNLYQQFIIAIDHVMAAEL